MGCRVHGVVSGCPTHPAGHIQAPLPHTAETLPVLSFCKLHTLPPACSLSVPTEACKQPHGGTEAAPQELLASLVLLLSHLPTCACTCPFPVCGLQGTGDLPALSLPLGLCPSPPDFPLMASPPPPCTLAFSLFIDSARLSHSLSPPVFGQACATQGGVPAVAPLGPEGPQNLTHCSPSPSISCSPASLVSAPTAPHCAPPGEVTPDLLLTWTSMGTARPHLRCPASSSGKLSRTSSGFSSSLSALSVLLGRFLGLLYGAILCFLLPPNTLPTTR